MQAQIYAASDTLKNDAVYVCEFDYQPKEPAIFNPVERAHPGMDASVDLRAVELWLNGKCIAKDFLTAMSESEVEHVEIELLQLMIGE